MSDIASRVASSFLASKGLRAEAEAAARTAKVPLSGPGKQMFKGLVKKMDDAIDEEDHIGFAKSLIDLKSSWDKLNPKGLEKEASSRSAALPKSGPGMEMFKGMLDKLMSAYEEGDGDAFGKALEGLQRSHDKLAR